MTLTKEQIKDYIFGLNIRNYNKTEIYELLSNYYGLKNIHKIEIFRYGESFDIHLRYGGIDIFWEENVKMLDNNNVLKRRYKFRQQIYKNLPKYIGKKPNDDVIDIQSILSKYQN